MFELVLALMGFAFVSSITPGPNNLMLMTSGANFGFNRTLPHMMGVCLGFTFMIAVVGLGMMTLFEAYPIVYQVLKYACIAYLIYLAYRIATTHDGVSEQGEKTKPLSFIQAALFQWINPKAWSMALTAVTVYSLGNGTEAMLVLALIFGVINLPAITTWVLLGLKIKRLLTNPQRLKWFNRTMAILLLATLYPVVNMG